MTTNLHHRQAKNPTYPVAGVAFAILGSLAAYFCYHLSVASREIQDWEVRRSQEDFERQLAGLKSGRSNRVHYYDTRQTDVLVHQLEGRPDVHELGFELCDVTEVGLQSASTLPNLRRLVLYGGRGIDDRAIAHLRGMTSLEELELTNTQATGAGLRLLNEIPNLHTLTIFCESRLGVLDDSALLQLEGMRQLELLTITGGWASQQAIDKLRTLLPTCTITSD